MILHASLPITESAIAFPYWWRKPSSFGLTCHFFLSGSLVTAALMWDVSVRWWFWFSVSYCVWSDLRAIWSCGAGTAAPWTWDWTVQRFWVCSSQSKHKFDILSSAALEVLSMSVNSGLFAVCSSRTCKGCSKFEWKIGNCWQIY